MSLDPIFTGAIHFPVSGTFVDNNGNVIDLTGATLTARLSVNNGAGFDGSGTMVIVNAAQGSFTYKFSATDIATPGLYQLQFVATFADGPAKGIPITFNVLASI